MMRKRKNAESATLDSSEGAIANKETEGLSQSQIVFGRFLRHRGAMISIMVLSFLILTVFSALDKKI